ncbi:MAG: hypothetical protein IJ733_17960 [Lachnospiraceae bacterium]|nr:hypothetical protein [Lachnospiraceae bacterium]
MKFGSVYLIVKDFDKSVSFWYFSFLDPDGNPIEVTGDYKEECDDNNTYEQDC